MIAAESDDEPPAIALRRPPERRQVEPAQRAARARSGRSCREIPGTTRDAIDTTPRLGPQRDRADRHGRDPAPRQGRRRARPRSATRRSARCKAIARADVAVLVIDAVDGLTAQDAHVAGYVVEEGRGLVVAVNKWDVVEEKTDRTLRPVRRRGSAREVAVPRLRPDRVDQRRRPASASSKVLELAVDVWGERRTPDLDRRAQPAPRRPRRERQPAAGQGPPPEDLLRHPGGASRRRRSCSSPATRLGPLQLPALPREPAARGVRLRRHADPARLPRAELGRAAAPPSGPAAAGAEGRRRRGGVSGSREGRPARSAAAGSDRRRASPSSARAPGARRSRDPRRAARAGHAPRPLRRDGRADPRRPRATSARLPGIDLPAPARGHADPAALAARPTSSSSPSRRATSGRGRAGRAAPRGRRPTSCSVVKGLEAGRCCG